MTTIKKILFFLALSINLIGCNKNKIDKSLIEGKWKFDFDFRDEIITFKKGLYYQTIINDDLIVTNKGKYFFNENTNRSTITITLAPDIKIYEGDTILQDCRFLDLISLTDSVLIIKIPTEWSHDFYAERQSRINRKIKVYKVTPPRKPDNRN